MATSEKAGEQRKSRRARSSGKNGERELPCLVSSQPPLIFRAGLFSRSAFPTILPGTGYRIYSNKRRPRISAARGTKQVNKRGLRIRAAVPMRRLLEEFRISKKPLQSNSKTALEISFSSKAMLFSSNLERSDSSLLSLT